MRFVKIVVLLCLFVGVANAQPEEKVILNGSVLSKGFGMGVDSSDKKRDWLNREPEYMKCRFRHIRNGRRCSLRLDDLKIRQGQI